MNREGAPFSAPRDERATRPGRAGQRSGRGSFRSREWIPEWLKSPFYAIYNQRLRAKVAAGTAPRHIAVILDGNRRYARRNGLAGAEEAYAIGTTKVEDMLRWCDQFDIPVVTVWILSLDNLARDTEDVAGLLRVVEERLPRLRQAQAGLKRPRQIRAVGRMEALPPSLRQAAQQVEAETAGNGTAVLNIAMGYGGREEIVDAVRRLLVQESRAGRTPEELAQRITPQDIADHLYFSATPEPELIIRTSGEIRLSGFMLWESVYSEYYFCDVLWPSFREIDFLRALRSFQERHRRYGQ